MEINVKLLAIILILFLSDISFLKFNENTIAFVKNNIVNSARLPKLNENLQSCFKNEIPNKSEVDKNKLFCKIMIIK